MSLRRVDFDLHFKLDCDWDWEFKLLINSFKIKVSQSYMA